MNKLFFLFFAVVFCSCNTGGNDIIGEWDLKSKYLRSKYKFEKKDGKTIARLLYYNDDTTILRDAKGTNDKYVVFKNIKYKGDHVFYEVKEKKVSEEKKTDAVSGETKKMEKGQPSFELKHKDTMEMKTFVGSKPLVQLWIRTKK